MVEQNRDAPDAACWINELGSPGQLPRCCTTTARRSPPASSPGHHASRARPPSNRRSVMTFIAKPRLHHPTLTKNKVGYTRARLRRQDPRCVPAAATTRHRPPSSRFAGSWTSSRTAWPSCRHRLQQQDARLLPRRQPRLQHRARPHAQRADRRQPGNRELLYLGVRATAIRPHRPQPVRHAMRRGVRMAYIVENNGVYGLTKGQFGHRRPRQQEQEGWSAADSPVDLVGWRTAAGRTCTWHAAFGDKAQLVPLGSRRHQPWRRGVHWTSSPVRACVQQTTRSTKIHYVRANTTSRSAVLTHIMPATRSRSKRRPARW